MAAPRALIAVINDDPAIVAFLREALEEEGYDTLGGFVGHGAYEIIRHWTPALVIIDMQMEQRDAGLRVAQAMRRDPVTQHIPVILCSADGFSLRQQAEQLRSYQCYPLDKPFELGTLLDLVAALVSPAGG